MKKNKRVGSIIDELTKNPCRLYDSKYFCNKFDIAKSSFSEDISMVSEIFQENGSGRIESIPGAGGGIKFIPGISPEQIKELQDELASLITDSSRVLGGGFLYTSDIMFDGRLVQDMARIFAQKFYELDADCVVTIETKGIPLAAQVAHLLNVPLVVIRREAKYSEGSTVSINYFSGSHDRIQKMSIAKRAVEPGSRAIVIDDFMRGGGSLKGIEEILNEFDVETIAIGVAIAAVEPVKKKVDSYLPIMYIDRIDEDEKKVEIRANEEL